MAVNRRMFTDEFKAEAVRLVTVEGHPARQVARDLDIHEALLRRWQLDDALRQDAEISDPFGSSTLKAFRPVHSSKLDIRASRHPRSAVYGSARASAGALYSPAGRRIT